MVGISVNTTNPKSLTQNLQYEDTWQIAAGLQYKVSPELLFSAGFAYDSSMVSDANSHRQRAGRRTIPLRGRRTIPVERAPHDRPFVRV